MKKKAFNLKYIFFAAFIGGYIFSTFNYFYTNYILDLIPILCILFFFKYINYKIKLSSYELVILFLWSFFCLNYLFIGIMWLDAACIIKSIIYFISVISVIMFLKFIKYDELKIILKLSISISLPLHFIWLVCFSKIHGGKFESISPGLMNFSSNELSYILLFSIFIPLNLILLDNIKMPRKKYFYFFLLYTFPFIHLSKSHIIIYILSILFSYFTIVSKHRKLFILFFIIPIILIVTFEIVKYFSRYNWQLFILYKALKLILNLEVTSPIDLFNKIHLFHRAEIWEYVIKGLKENTFGYACSKSHEILHYKDYHSIYFYILLQSGIFNLITFILIMVYLLLIKLKNKYLQFLKNFIIFYLILRGNFITIDIEKWIIIIFIIMYIDKLKYHNNFYMKCLRG